MEVRGSEGWVDEKKVVNSTFSFQLWKDESKEENDKMEVLKRC